MTAPTVRAEYEGLAAIGQGASAFFVRNLRAVGDREPGARSAHPPSAQQFIRGVVWLDDPKGYLFYDPRITENYSAGALNHMIQDSYAAGHVDRDPLTGAIREFHNYGAQDTDTIVRYLDQQVFPLDPGVRPSGPGEPFVPKKPASTRA